MSAFGEKIADLRKERGLTVKEVCQLVGIPQSRLSELERYFEINAGDLAELVKL